MDNLSKNVQNCNLDYRNIADKTSDDKTLRVADTKNIIIIIAVFFFYEYHNFVFRMCPLNLSKCAAGHCVFHCCVY